ncbi:hypothetical protein TNCV_2690431 [Trichonephila clavipes]|uniref:Uncharacterized protein n=1 Tax=Trichonephila clavipes TaxID=2585209 RepID=A0A8X6VYP9_TRICX|nr:hypothetical protein TNCV_2690431 [Trichonephila clavipes]
MNGISFKKNRSQLAMNLTNLKHAQGLLHVKSLEAQNLPVGMRWNLREVLPAQISSSALDHGSVAFVLLSSAYREPSSLVSPRVASIARYDTSRHSN